MRNGTVGLRLGEQALQLGANKKLISELRTEDSQQFRNLKRVSVVEVQSIMDVVDLLLGGRILQ
jgi:H2-forming N5,N10-methylenetetrahydromethanopterin dehydrogenase-like enzyme